MLFFVFLCLCLVGVKKFLVVFMCKEMFDWYWAALSSTDVVLQEFRYCRNKEKACQAIILSQEHKKHDYMEAQALAEANKQGKLAQTYHGESIEKRKSNEELIVPREAYQRSLYVPE
ncbi:hypothetical protein E3N88_26053 [Mikania micrantha]|uniref:Flotillin-like n=1 Tax=Mikania micrantha TaxID=192012 RepID=A0A5N6N6L7_9ASTR|nr:hypothetical protein E3N88_26053 [Mikania micrantha]